MTNIPLGVAGNPKIAARFWKYVDQEPGCWTWIGTKTSHGYGVFRIGKCRVRAHRVSYELTNGPLPISDAYHGVCVLHRCDNPICVNPDHLFLGSQADNTADMRSKGRAVYPRPKFGDDHHMRRRPELRPWGEKNPASRLTAGDVAAIKKRRANGETLTAIAGDFGVAFQTISRIARGDRWCHVQPS